MHQQRNADQRYRERRRKVRPPDHHTAGQQQHQANDCRPEYALLTEIITPGVTHFLVHGDFMDVFGPDDVLAIDQIMLPITQEHQQESRKHNHADKGVQNARQLRRTENVHQPVEGGEKEPQPADGGEHKAERHNPVVNPLRRAVALNTLFLFHLRVSSSCSSSLSSSSTRFGPTPT
ncbi:hypothetical protein D3C87_1436200 [compost metagenome]